MTGNVRQVSVSRVIAAPADKIFDVLADPQRHAEIDGSGTVKQSTFGPARLALGEKFGMKMRIGLPYRVGNTVVELEDVIIPTPAAPPVTPSVPVAPSFTG